MCYINGCMVISNLHISLVKLVKYESWIMQFFLTAFHHARYEIIIKHLCRQFFFESKELFCTFSFLTFFQVMFIICMTTYILWTMSVCTYIVQRTYGQKVSPPFLILREMERGGSSSWVLSYHTESSHKLCPNPLWRLVEYTVLKPIHMVELCS